MAIPLLRILTRKSLFKIGKNKDLTVQKMLDLRKQIQLISAYYNLTSINYQDDILKELRITDKWVIEKPGKDPKLYLKFLKDRGFKKRTTGAADKLRKETRTPTRAILRNINQGKRN